MSELAIQEEKQELPTEAKGIVTMFLAMVGMLIFWLWIFFDVMQPWVEGM